MLATRIWARDKSQVVYVSKDLTGNPQNVFLIECDLELDIPQPKIESYIGDGVRSNHPESKMKVKGGQNSL